MKEKRKRFSLASAQGCRWLLAIMLVIILVCSYFAYMIACDWGKVKVSDVAIDSRGSIMKATMYTPRIVHIGDNLPAVLVTHGASCSHSTVNGLAEELARRGFAVLSLSTYGSGSSETVLENDDSSGIMDALQYMRTLQYIDKTRIGVVGHSAGSQRAAAAVSMDCSYLTPNDMMINVLYEEFGQEFTPDEISMDADELASARLNADQMQLYNVLKEEKLAQIDNSIYAALILGGNWGFEEKTVTVGGYEVQRTPYCNGAWQVALFNEGRAQNGQSNLVSESMLANFQTSGKVNIDTWYQIHTYNGTERPVSDQLGSIWDLSSGTDEELKAAMDSRSTRIFFTPKNTHARDYFSKDAAKYVVKYFEQALSYNNGELSDPATVPEDCSHILFIRREFLNLIAMLALFGAMLALAGIMINSRYFAECKKPLCEPIASKKSVVFWALAVVYAIATYMTASFVSQNGPNLGFKNEFAKKFWSMDFTANIHMIFMWILAAVALVLVAIYCIYNYKVSHRNVLRELNFITKPSSVFKYLLISAVLFLGAYAVLAFVQFFFHQDFRFWDNGVKDMLPQNFIQCIRYAIPILPTFLVGGLFVNAGRMKDMKDGPNTIIQMIIPLVGLVAAYAVSYLTVYVKYANTGVADLPRFAFVSLWPMFINIPLFVLLGRLFYKLTGSVWLGAFVNTSIVCWSICSGQSSTAYYLLGDFATKWLGIF